jgi:hypothetical protein
MIEKLKISKNQKYTGRVIHLIMKEHYKKERRNKKRIAKHEETSYNGYSTTLLSTVILNISVLNSPIKTHRVTKWIYTDINISF